MRSLKSFICLLGVGVFCVSLQATIPDGSADHYAVIPQRNAFGLKPPQENKETNPPPPLPKIVLTGITTVVGKRALLKTQPASGKPGQQEKEVSLILAEGQREAGIEVLQIDEKVGSVKINNSGTVMTLTFEKDGAKLPATPAPASPPGGIPPVATGIPVPVRATNPVALNPAFTNTPGMHPLPTRNFRATPTPALTTPVPAQAGLGQAPVGGVPTPAGVVPAPAVVTQPNDLTAEEQAILQQIQREVTSPVTPIVSNVAPGSAQLAPPVLPQ